MGIKISQLPVASTSQDTDIIPIVQAGVTKQIQKSIFNQNINEEIETIQQDISDIQEEQTTQNENIQENADNIIALTEKHNKEIEALENILPKSTATGENISVSNSADYKFNYFNNGGNTHQDSYSGKNKFPNSLTNDGTAIRQQGCTVTVNNDEFTFVANATQMFLGSQTGAGGDYNKINGSIIEVPENLRTIYVMLTNEEFNEVLINDYDENKVSLRYSFATKNNNIFSYSVLPNTKYISIRIGKTNAVSGTTYKTKIMASFENVSYEPYVGGTQSPSPSFPQKVNNVGSNVNLLNYNNKTDNLNIGGSNKLNTLNGWNVNYINIENLQQITLSTSATRQWVLAFGNDIPANNTDCSNRQILNGKNITIDVPNGYTYLYLRDSATANEDNQTVKIEEGSIATGYTPYNRGGIDVKVENKNLLDITSFKKGYINSSGAFVSENLTALFDTFIKVKENNYYNLSANDTLRSLTLIYYDKNYNFVSRDVYGNMSNKSFLIPSNVEYVLCQCSYNNSEITQEIINGLQIQFEKGESRTSYIAHQEQNITIPLPVGMELCKIGNYSDKIFHNIPSNPMYNASLTEGGLYKYNGVIGEDLKSKISNFAYNSKTSTEAQFITPALSSQVISLEKNISSSNSLKSNITNKFYGTNTTQNIIRFNIDMSILGTTSASTNNEQTTALRNLLNNLDKVLFYYPLATPTYTQITDTDTLEALNTLENTKTYQGGTNISSDNIPSPIFDVQYFLDLQSLFN